MIDIHCHLLAGVDDGAPTLEEAVAMARVLEKCGYHTLAISPHVGEGPGGNVPRALAELKRAELAEHLHKERIEIAILPNGEHHLTTRLLEMIQARDVTPIGGSSSWLLVELPWPGMAQIESGMFNLQLSGFDLVLAHPERYSYLDIPTVQRLVERGVKMQVELGSFIKMYGQRAHGKVMAMMEQQLVHVIATDLHRSKDAAQWIPAAFSVLEQEFGKEARTLLAVTNPQALCSGAAEDSIFAYC